MTRETMPLLPCPSCGRALSVPDHMSATHVRCPSCKTVFQSPSAEPAIPVAAPVAPAVVPSAPSASSDPFDFDAPIAPPSPEQAFGFDRNSQEASDRVRVRARARTAGTWMTVACVFLFIDSLGCLVGEALSLTGGSSAASPD